MFLNLLDAAKGALIRAAASTQTFCRFALPIEEDVISFEACMKMLDSLSQRKLFYVR